METGALTVQPRNVTKGIFSEEGKNVPFQAHAKAGVTRSTGWLPQRVRQTQLWKVNADGEVGPRPCRGLVMDLGFRWFSFH